MKRVKWSKFKDIIFDPVPHTYRLNNEIFTSCTQFTGKFKNNIFTEQFISNFAKRENFSIDYVKELWDLNKKFGTELGSLVHYYIEWFLKEGIKSKVNPKIQTEIDYFHKFLDDYKWLEPVQLEYIIYDKDLKIAGTIDALFRDKENPDDYYIIDWKSNKTISLKNNVNFKSPLSYLNQSDFNNYSLQLSLYKYILEKNLGINIKDTYLIHFNSSNNNYVNYNVSYLRK